MMVAVLALAGCATGIDTRKYNSDTKADPHAFKICHGYSCTYKTKTGFTKAEWQKIAAPFKKPAKTPEAERSKIAGAIAQMERIVGKKTGTDQDLPMAGSFKENNNQLDCIDETVNTTQYLTMLQDAGLFKFHERTEPTHRGYFVDGKWPHNTAVIKETKSGKMFVVDAFYKANGEEPYIVPRASWLAGWKPPGANQ